MFGEKITSIKEGLNEDLNDLHEVLIKASEDSKSAMAAANLISPYLGVFKILNMQDKESSDSLISNAEKFKQIMGQLDKLVALSLIELQTREKGLFVQVQETLNVDIINRIQQHYKDVKKDFEELIVNLEKAHMTGQKIEESIKDIPIEAGVPGLQKILFERGFMGKTWTGKATGEMDDDTLKAASELESLLDESIKKLSFPEDISFVGKIVKDGQLVIDINKLSELLERLEKKLGK
jgi:hypothetical protein